MLVLWTWMLFCTLVAAQVQTVEQAVAALRFFVFTLAIGIMLECWRQYLFGASVLGYRRYIDGALTGPFQHPIAGGTYLAVLFCWPCCFALCFMLLPAGRSVRLCC
jgi:hypothetical protein